MQSKAATPDQYIKELPPERKEAISALRDIILKNLPKGFNEEMSYGILVMWCRTQFIRRAIIVILNYPFLLWL